VTTLLNNPLLIVGLMVAFYLASSIKILNEYERGVIFRLGKLLTRPKGPGVILVFAPIDRMVRVGLRTIVMDVPPQDIITRDNVSVKVNAVVFFRVVDPTKAVIEVEDYLYATSQLAQTTLRSVLGQVDLDDLLSQRDQLNVQLQGILDKSTDPWGIKVASVEVKHVDLPGESRDGAHKALSGLDGQRDTLSRYLPAERIVLRGEAGHVEPAIAGPPDAITARDGRAGMGIDPQPEHAVLFLQQKLRIAGRDPDPVARLMEDIGVPRQFKQSRGAEAALGTASPALGALDDSLRDSPILVGEKVQRPRLRLEPPERHNSPLAPGTAPGLALLLRRRGDVSVPVLLQKPGQTPLAGTGGLLAAAALRPRFVGNLLDPAELPFPFRNRDHEGSQRGRAKFLAGRRDELREGGRNAGAAESHQLRQFPLRAVLEAPPPRAHIETLGREPAVPVSRGLRAEVQQCGEMAPALPVGKALVPTGRQSPEEPADADVAHMAAPANAASIPTDFREGDQDEKVVVRVDLLGDAQQVLQLRRVGGRVVPDQRKQGKRERQAQGKHVSPAGARLLAREGFVDEADGLGVVAPQHGQKSAGGGQAGPRLLARAGLAREFGKDLQRFVEGAPERVDAGHAGGVSRAVGRAPRICTENRRPGFGRPQDLGEAALEGGVAVSRRQLGQHRRAARAHQPTPVLRAEVLQLPVEFGESSRHRMAAMRHRGGGLVEPVA